MGESAKKAVETDGKVSQTATVASSQTTSLSVSTLTKSEGDATQSAAETLLTDDEEISNAIDTQAADSGLCESSCSTVATTTFTPPPPPHPPMPPPPSSPPAPPSPSPSP